MGKINILGVNIDNLNKEQVLAKIGQFLADSGGSQSYIVTPNPEIILIAQEDEEFFYILNKADLAIPDGVGLKFAGWLMGRNIKRYTGADLVKDILEDLRFKNPSNSAGRYDLRIGIINRKDSLSKKEDIEKVLRNKYSKLKFLVEDIQKGTESLSSGTRSLENFVDFKPDILFCALGALWQEKFIYHNLKKLPSVKLAIGVGGAFDFLTGKTKRAPRAMRFLGLEWLWRIFQEKKGRKFWRFKRIVNAVIVFPLKFFKWRFILPFFYRSNVACLLYKKEIKRAATNGAHPNQKKSRYKIFLVERNSDRGHWQLPQGGTDGYDLFTAGAKELSEESGTDKFKPVRVFKTAYKYNFGAEKGRADIFCRHIHGYKGQQQGLFIAEFIGQDEDIKISFWDHSGWKWVAADDLVEAVHPIRKEAAKIFLNKFKQII